MELLKIIAEALRGASIVMILVSFFLCNYGILQADWGYFNNDIAFGPLGGPVCYHNNTEDVQKCKDAFRGRFDADVGHAILTILALGPALGLIALCGLIHNVFSEMWETAASGTLLLIGTSLCVLGLIMANRQVDYMLHLNITDFINKPSYNEVSGAYIYIYGCSLLTSSFISVVGLFVVTVS
uniref:Claudin n=1 Tax=Bursaphelenchus xylophilus TaxID=6326 RepID=A0A1I7SVD2_BURXY